MAGFSVGMVDKEKMIDGTTIKPGDALIGVASSGVHSNGYFARAQDTRHQRKVRAPLHR